MALQTNGSKVLILLPQESKKILFNVKDKISSKIGSRFNNL